MHIRSRELIRTFFVLFGVTALLHAWPWTPENCPVTTEKIIVDGLDPDWENIPVEKIKDNVYISTVRYKDTLFVLVRMDLRQALMALTSNEGLKLRIVAGQESFETGLRVDRYLFESGIMGEKPVDKTARRDGMEKGSRRTDLTQTEKMNILQLQQIFIRDSRQSLSYSGKSPYVHTGIQYSRYIVEYRIPLSRGQDSLPGLLAKTGSKVTLFLQSSTPERLAGTGRSMGMDAQSPERGSSSMKQGGGSGKGRKSEINGPAESGFSTGLDYKKKWIL